MQNLPISAKTDGSAMSTQSQIHLHPSLSLLDCTGGAQEMRVAINGCKLPTKEMRELIILQIFPPNSHIIIGKNRMILGISEDFLWDSKRTLGLWDVCLWFFQTAHGDHN